MIKKKIVLFVFLRKLIQLLCHVDICVYVFNALNHYNNPIKIQLENALFVEKV
jgi:hypothetical protein